MFLWNMNSINIPSFLGGRILKINNVEENYLKVKGCNSIEANEHKQGEVVSLLSTQGIRR